MKDIQWHAIPSQTTEGFAAGSVRFAGYDGEKVSFIVLPGNNFTLAAWRQFRGRTKRRRMTPMFKLLRKEGRLLSQYYDELLLK